MEPTIEILLALFPFKCKKWINSIRTPFILDKHQRNKHTQTFSNFPCNLKKKDHITAVTRFCQQEESMVDNW